MAADGWFDIPTGPGLGVEVDEKFLAGHAIDPSKAPTHTAYESPKAPPAKASVAKAPAAKPPAAKPPAAKAGAAPG
jgi:hypothetical protein